MLKVLHTYIEILVNKTTIKNAKASLNLNQTIQK